MVSFESLKAGYEKNWANLQIRPDRLAQAKAVAHKAINGKATYQQIQLLTQVPWQFIALCHYREADFDFDSYLGNGEALDRVTSLVPKGRGPFATFVDGAVDALRIQGFVGAKDWSIARTLFRLEAYNGFGYHFKGVNSPYLYGGSTLYGPPEARAGKYIRDHVFDPNFDDPQLGTAVVLHEMMSLDPSITYADSPHIAAAHIEPDDEMAVSVLAMQKALNELGADPQLVEDGISGPMTKGAVSRFQQQHKLKDTGLLDGITIAAITRATQTGHAVPLAGDLSHILKRLDHLSHAVQSGGTTPAVVTPAVAASGTEAADLSQIENRLDHLAQLLLLRTSHVPAPIAIAPIPTPSFQLSQVLNRLDGLAQILAREATPAGTTPAGPVPAANDPLGLLQRLFSVVNKTAPVPATTTNADPADQLKQVVALLSALLSNKRLLGQVNGALGETIGNLLNGKKTAIGTILALVTSILSNVTASAGSGGIEGLLGTIANSVPGLSQFMLPISLALAAWGVLGKLEKWAQGTAPPPKPTS
jgi:lysozyme family protein/peptidoglycan hydrolase-like protein with peptidoglycan-binding domain